MWYRDEMLVRQRMEEFEREIRAAALRAQLPPSAIPGRRRGLRAAGVRTVRRLTSAVLGAPGRLGSGSPGRSDISRPSAAALVPRHHT